MVTKGQLSERLGDYGGELRKLEAQIEELQEWREAKASLLWAKEQSVYLSRENAGRIAVLEKEAAAASAAAVRIRDLEGIVSAMGKRLGSKDIQLESMVRAAEGRIAALEQVVAERWGPTDGRHEMLEVEEYQQYQPFCTAPYPGGDCAATGSANHVPWCVRYA